MADETQAFINAETDRLGKAIASHVSMIADCVLKMPESIERQNVIALNVGDAVLLMVKRRRGNVPPGR